jgi:hypothetical protein
VVMIPLRASPSRTTSLTAARHTARPAMVGLPTRVSRLTILNSCHRRALLGLHLHWHLGHDHLCAEPHLHDLRPWPACTSSTVSASVSLSSHCMRILTLTCQTTTTTSVAMRLMPRSAPSHSSRATTSYGRLLLVIASYLLTNFLPQNAVTTPSLTGGNSVGNEYFLQSTTDAATCKTNLGRTCYANSLVGGSGSVASRVTSSVLTALKSRTYITSESTSAKGNPDVLHVLQRPLSRVTLRWPPRPWYVSWLPLQWWPILKHLQASYVQANAGLGKVN